ncbi:MAG: prepilin-type N-terminal cleavage/methylation domain-containing protein [Rhodospirillales bacterium]|nr:prepilin-type N-terminal cleavage/methylation domain-containing protein [Rhodospirillales bacterium]
MYARRYAKDQSGFSLIEIAVVLVILGLLIPPLVIAYNVTMQRIKYQKTRAAFSSVEGAINLFVVNNGRYPVPASLAGSEGDAWYGTEGNNATPELCTSATWFASDGMCVTNTVPEILIGAVPFDALGLEPENTEDYWHRKLLYAVTRSQATAGSYIPKLAAGSGITAMAYGDMAAAPANLPGAYDMVLVSFGENGEGAYTNRAVAMNICAPGGVVQLENQNCDYDDVFMLDSHPNSSFRATGARSMVNDANYYDDFTSEQEFVPAGIWFENGIDPDYAMTLSAKVGIGTVQPKDRLHVIGGVRAGNGVSPASIITPEICDKYFEDPGAECFETELIGGNRPEMDCGENLIPGDEPVLKVGNDQVYCASPVDSFGSVTDASGTAYKFSAGTFTPLDCPSLLGPGAMMTGIDGAGVVTCALP